MSTDEARLKLLERLRAHGYEFVTPTPATHRRILRRRAGDAAATLRDVFGWNLPFSRELLPADLFALMECAEAIGTGDAVKSAFRVSSLGPHLFLHSSFPTDDEDAVFFGPDSYRFARLIQRQLQPELPDGAIVDMGAGSGVGAIVAAGKAPSREIVMTDVNGRALSLARVNARFAGVEARTVETEGLQGVDGPIAAVLANPPYIADDAGRDYRDGGEMHGGALSVEMAREAVQRLAPGGRLVLYTGSAIVGGRDELGEALKQVMQEADCAFRYEEIDPDVFGEELDRPAYADVDRIAVVSLVALKR